MERGRIQGLPIFLPPPLEKKLETESEVDVGMFSVFYRAGVPQSRDSSPTGVGQ